MAYWLVKSEPETFGWDDQVRDRISHWDGVRNYQAAANLKAMRRADTAFFYHSVAQKQIVGIVRVVREAYPDASDPTGRFVMVDFETVEALPHPVTLATIKADPLLADLPLVRQSRLSVMPIPDTAWARIRRLGGLA